MKKLLIFDCDGTLVDTDKVIIETWKELFKNFKPKDYVIDEIKVRGYSGPPVTDSIAEAFPEYDPNFILKEYRKRTVKYYEKYAILFESERLYLDLLKKEGYKMAVCSSKNREMLEFCFKKLDLFKYFDVIVTSTDGLKCKPDPESIYYILNKENLKKEDALMIGDTKFDYLTAKNAGIECVLMTMCPRSYEDSIKPIAIVKNYQELYKLIQKL